MKTADFLQIVAVPRMHREYVPGGNILTLDPTQRDEKAFRADFPWDRQYAVQCLADVEQNTRDFVRDREHSVYDMAKYQENSFAETGLNRDEIRALEEFMGKSSESPLEDVRLTAQRMLIFAYYNEKLSLELAPVLQKVQEKQKALKELIEDENGELFRSETDDILISWKRVFPAFLVFTQEADAYCVNDAEMAKEVCSLAETAEEDGNFLCAAVKREKLAAYVPKTFQPFLTKEEYRFLCPKELL